MEKIFLAILQMVPGIGSMRLRKLIEHFGNAQNVWNAGKLDLQASGCIDRVTCDKLTELKRRSIDVDQLASTWEKQKIHLCSYQDDMYPKKLKDIYNPPMLFFYRGKLAFANRSIAIVGARKASTYGRNIARMLGCELTKAKFSVVSGAARGIDTAAHQGALEIGSTIAVLGCGVDVSYPPENKKLLDQIAEVGLIISEYAPGTNPNPTFFPSRNRIISGLTDGTVVVEAALKSGSLITAEYALNEGRDVFAVPGSIFSATSKGCHKLIQQGAKLVESTSDILEEYNVTYFKNEKSGNFMLSQEEKAIYDLLSYHEPMTVDEIILKTRSDASNINFILLQMELRGLLHEHSPHCYVRAMKEDIL